VPEKRSAQVQVDDGKSGECKTCEIVHRYPLLAGDAKTDNPAAPSSPLFVKTRDRTSLPVKKGMNTTGSTLKGVGSVTAGLSDFKCF